MAIFACASLAIAAPGVTGVFFNSYTGVLAIEKPTLALIVLAWSMLSFLVLVGMDRVSSVRRERVLAQGVSPLLSCYSLARIALVSVFIFISWIPYLIALYPGPTCADSYTQIAMFLRGRGESLAHFSDHHPLVDTLIYGVFVYPSEQFFGEWTYGLFAFAVVQAAMFAVTLSCLLAYLTFLGASKAFVVGGVAFYTLLPLFGVYSGMMLKDVTFSLGFLWWMMMLVEIAHTKGNALGKRGFLVAFVSLSLLLPLTKKVGLAVTVPTLLSFALYFRIRIKELSAISAVSVLVVLGLFPMVIFPMLDVEPGGKQEMLGIPFQQTARFVKHHGSEISEEDVEKIDRVLVYDTLAERYDPVNADPVKFGWNGNCTDAEIVAYLAVWVKQGVEDPILYAKSVISTCRGFFSPTYLMDIYISPVTSASLFQEGDISYPDGLAKIRSDIGTAYKLLGESGMGLPLYIVIYSWWLPVIAMCLSVARREKSAALCILPAVLTACTCLLSFGPGIGRYVLHMVYVSPLLLYVGWFGLPQLQVRNIVMEMVHTEVKKQL